MDSYRCYPWWFLGLPQRVRKDCQGESGESGKAETLRRSARLGAPGDTELCRFAGEGVRMTGGGGWGS